MLCLVQISRNLNPPGLQGLRGKLQSFYSHLKRIHGHNQKRQWMNIASIISGLIFMNENCGDESHVLHQITCLIKKMDLKTDGHKQIHQKKIQQSAACLVEN
ncbi:hypothetical protein ACJX0J_040482, partial [Zea mays]